jgi:hypothetical protein
VTEPAGTALRRPSTVIGVPAVGTPATAFMRRSYLLGDSFMFTRQSDGTTFGTSGVAVRRTPSSGGREREGECHTP